MINSIFEKIDFWRSHRCHRARVCVGGGEKGRARIFFSHMSGSSHWNFD